MRFLKGLKSQHRGNDKLRSSSIRTWPPQLLMPLLCSACLDAALSEYGRQNSLDNSLGQPFQKMSWCVNAIKRTSSDNGCWKSFLNPGAAKLTLPQNCQNHSGSTLRTVFPTLWCLQHHQRTISYPQETECRHLPPQWTQEN